MTTTAKERGILCACVHHDACECARIRDGRDSPFDENHQRRACECCCHYSQPYDDEDEDEDEDAEIERTTSMALQLKFKRLRPDAILPRINHPGEDAAFDLFTPDPWRIQRGWAFVIKLGFASEIPPGYWVHILGRSGHAVKNGVAILGGVIDSGYRGEWGVIVANIGSAMWDVEPGQAIAQAVLHRIPEFSIVEVDELAPSARGEKGLGRRILKRQASNPALIEYYRQLVKENPEL